MRLDKYTKAITSHATAIIVLMLVASAVMGAGIANLDQSPGLDQFQFDTEEGDALDYIDENFEVDENETTAQVILRDQDNALSRDSFLQTLELQEDLRDDPAVNETLTEEPFQDLASIVATQAIREDEIAELEERNASLAEDRAEAEATAASLSDGINETTGLQTDYEELNASFEAGEIDEETYNAEAEAIETDMAAVETETTADLEEDQAAAYTAMLAEARSIQAEIVQTEMAFERGEITEEERDAELDRLGEDMEAVYERIETDVLADTFASLEDRGEALQEDQEALAELDPSLEEQREALEERDDEEVEAIVADLLDEDANRGVFVFVPTDFEPGDTETDARQLFISQSTEAEELIEGEAPDRIVDSQLAIADHVNDRFADGGFTFGVGIITDEIDRSMADSLAIVLPLALLFVVVVLTIAYRDPLDILLGVAGIGLVLTWTFGFMGWTGITFNQIMIAVPVLLVGLSIDYAIHVFMRHRERRAEEDRDTRSAMDIVVLGLGVALVWVTITAMIGFLANLVSPVAPIRDFGIVSAFGIFATLLIFGTLIPATKVTLDAFLEARGWDRRKRAFGTGGGSLTRVLRGGSQVAQRIPIGVVLLALLLTMGGLYGAAQVDTEFQQEDFIADDPPDWMDRLPSAFAPGEYTVKANLDFVNERFLRQDANTQTLLRGDVTSDDTLERIDEAEAAAAEEDVVIVLSDDEADVQSPLSAMRELAERDEDFATVFEEADTTGDDVPDEDIVGVYEAFYDTAPEQADRFLYRTGEEEYEAARLVISIEGDATAGEATDATRRIAETMDGGDRSAIATGQLVVFHMIEDQLFESVLESLLVTLIAVFAFLMAAYRVVHGSALLGAVTLTPIVLAVAWILGTMHLLDIPFNVITGTITSLTIGLGVAYNIHISERYRLEVSRGRDTAEAMARAVTGTGGALLGSAATTVGGFGVLVFAILPPLQQFGIITGLTIIYAFLGSVFVLPSFLVLWTRHVGTAMPASDETEPSPDAADAGNPGAPEGPRRSVEPTIVAPGGDLSVRVETPIQPGRTVLREVFPGERLSIAHVSPEPSTIATAGGSVYVAWEVDEATETTLEYEGQAPQAPADTEIDWAGTLVAPGGGTVVGGTQSVQVVGNLAERILATNPITAEDLERASEAFEEESISEEQYRRIIEQWRASGPVPSATVEPEPEETDEADSGGGSWLPWR